MRLRVKTAVAAALVAAATVAACGNPLGRQYEYDEQTYLSVDGSATVVVNTSLPALVALRGASVDPKPDGAADRAAIRRMYEASGCRVTKVGRFWYRRGRRFVQIQVTTDDISTLSRCALFSWSSYALGPDPKVPDGLKFLQRVGPSAAADPGVVNWDGSEIIAFKLHAPSRIRFQNVKLLDGTNGSTERGNILTWEQRLADRRAGKPLDMEVWMDATSIVLTTVWLFLGAFGAAVGVLGMLIWLTIRRGRRASQKLEGRRQK